MTGVNIFVYGFFSLYGRILNSITLNLKVMLSPENGEQLQILHYEHGQKYEPHADFFVDDYNLQAGGNRVATVLMYLSNVDKGGETIFPAAEVHSNFFQVKLHCIN